MANRTTFALASLLLCAAAVSAAALAPLAPGRRLKLADIDSKIAKLFAKFPSVPVSSADANSDAQAEDGAVNNAEILAISATSPGKSNSISGADSDSFPGSGTDTKRPGSSAEANSAGRAMDGAINVSETKTETDTTPKSAKSNAKSAGGSFDRPGSGSLANALGGAAARNGTKNKERCNDEDTH